MLPYADLHIQTGKHQDQVKVTDLIETRKTASSLDDSALRMSLAVQQNNIELCDLYAIKEYVS